MHGHLPAMNYKKGYTMDQNAKIKTRKPTGRPKLEEQIRTSVIQLYNQNTMTCKEIANACGICRQSVYNIINEERRNRHV